MSEKKKHPSGTPIFDTEKVKEYTKLIQDKVKEVMRLQSLGILPMASIIQRCHVKRKDVMEMLGVKESQAGRIMAEARQKANKKRNERITVKEFSLATNIDEHTIQRALDMLPMMNYNKN